MAVPPHPICSQLPLAIPQLPGAWLDALAQPSAGPMRPPPLRFLLMDLLGARGVQMLQPGFRSLDLSALGSWWLWFTLPEPATHQLLT